MAAANPIRVGADEVVWHEAESLEQLTELLRATPPEAKHGAYAILLAAPRAELRFVFAAGAFRALWRTLAEADFPAGLVAELLLPGVAVPIEAGARPEAPAYEPETGAVWVLAARRGKAESERFEQRTLGMRRQLEELDFLSLPRSSAPEAAAPLPEPAASAAEPLVRTPHMDVSPENGLGPGDGFRVEIFCDRSEARPGERSEQLAVDLPPGEDEVSLQAWLALSPHFAGASLVGDLAVSRDDPISTRATFDLTVVDDPPPGPGQIAAVFHHEGRPCGRVARSLAVGAAEPEPDAAAPPPRPPRLLLRESMRRADLTIEIKMTDRSEQEFACRVITPLLPDRLNPQPTQWRLPARAPDLVTSYLEGFTEGGLSDGERISRLRGAGIALWKAAPAEVREVFWELIDAGTPPGSIFVVSDEWSFPWELVVPERGSGAQRQTREPLGVEFPLGRWVSDEMVAPPQQLDVVDSYVFAPSYEPKLALANAAAEADYVCQNLNGEAIVPGEFDRLEAKFAERGVSLAHFTCHGGTSVDQSQVLLLEKDRRLLSHQIAAMPALSAAVAEREPLVFLNACEVGRPQPALIGVGGFASAFIAAGASCVVAPLWSVADDVAYELAVAFYDELKANPDTTPAAILRTLRARAYGAAGADTWAAYCFYGDPLTKVEI